MGAEHARRLLTEAEAACWRAFRAGWYAAERGESRDSGPADNGPVPTAWLDGWKYWHAMETVESETRATQEAEDYRHKLADRIEQGNIDLAGIAQALRDGRIPW
jgi:ribosome modulation factor